MEPDKAKKNIRLTRTSEIRRNPPEDGDASAPTIRPLRFKRPPASPANGPPVPPAGPPVPPPSAPKVLAPTPAPAGPPAPRVISGGMQKSSPAQPPVPPEQGPLRPSVTAADASKVVPPEPRPPGVGRKLRLRPMSHPPEMPVPPGVPPPPGVEAPRPPVQPVPVAPAGKSVAPVRAPPPASPPVKSPETPAIEAPPQKPETTPAAPRRERAMTDTTARPALRKRPLDETTPPEPMLFDLDRQEQIAEGAPRPPKKDMPAPANPLPGNVAVLAFFAAQLTSLLPVLLPWVRKGGELPVAELIVGLGMTLVFAVLVFIHKKPLRILAGLLAALNFLVAVAGLGLFVLLPYLPGLEPVRDRLLGLGVTTGAAFLFFAALLLLTGAGPVRWSLALLAVACGLAAPWTPLKDIEPAPSKGGKVLVNANSGPPSTGQPISMSVSTSGDVAVPVPNSWVPGSPPPGEQQVFKSPDGTLTLHLFVNDSDHSETLASYAKTQIQRLREQYPASGEMLVPVRGRPQWKKVIFASGKDRAEAVIAEKDNHQCMLLVAGREDAFRDHRAELDTIIERFAAP